MAKRPPVQFFMDQCVPDSVGRMLMDAEYDVIFLRQRLPPDSPDPLVAAISERHGAVLVSLDSDFSTLGPRFGVGRRRFMTLSRVALKCPEPQATRRMKDALSLIEHEWERMHLVADKRIIVEIGTTFIRTIR